MKKLVLALMLASIAVACNKKETPTAIVHNEKNISIVEVKIMPSFWFGKNILINIKEHYLLYQNETTNKDTAFHPEDASPSIMLQLTTEETQQLLDAYNKIVKTNDEYIFGPDGTDTELLVVSGDSILTIIPGHQANGIGKVIETTFDIILKKPVTDQVKAEIKRLRGDY